MEEKPKAKRGFAALSPERRKEIAAMGGKAVPAEKRFFSQERIEAQDAARKSHENRRPNQED